MSDRLDSLILRNNNIKIISLVLVDKSILFSERLLLILVFTLCSYMSVLKLVFNVNSLALTGYKNTYVT